MSEPGHDVTDLLLQWNEGNEAVLERLMPIVTDELRRLAASHMRGERADHTLQPTALVSEVYLRLIDRKRVSWRSRAQFFAFASHTMRRILVDHARAHRAEKRGGGACTVALDEQAVGHSAPREIDLLALDQALDRLAALDPRQARIVELRYFAGLSVEEIGAVLDTSAATVSRGWMSAKGWLFRELARR